MGGGGNTVGQISGQASNDARNLGALSIETMANRYAQLGLGQTGATPSGPTSGAVPGIPGSGTTPTIGGARGTGPTALQMEEGALPGWTNIPQEFQAALGEAQFQDLGQTASAAAGSAQAKGQTFSGIGSLAGALGGI
jgi:hypothetical protein